MRACAWVVVCAVASSRNHTRPAVSWSWVRTAMSMHRAGILLTCRPLQLVAGTSDGMVSVCSTSGDAAQEAGCSGGSWGVQRGFSVGANMACLVSTPPSYPVVVPLISFLTHCSHILSSLPFSHIVHSQGSQLTVWSLQWHPSSQPHHLIL